MNYGCILIPENFLAELPIFVQLIEEINSLKEVDVEEFTAEHLSAWNFALYSSMPLLFRQQLAIMRTSDGRVDMTRVSSEKILASLCQQELADRKKAGTYSGNFAPVTHHFSFQGKSAHPSLFD